MTKNTVLELLKRMTAVELMNLILLLINFVGILYIIRCICIFD